MKVRYGAFAILLAFAACSEQQSDPLAFSRTAVQSQDVLAQSATPDISKDAPFVVSLQPSGSIGAGSALNFQLSITARTAGLAAFEIYSPEIQSARRGQWLRPLLPPGRLPRLAEWREPVVPASSVSQALPLTIPRPGFYRIVVKATLVDIPLGEWNEYNDATIEVFWLLVHDDGGALLSRFEPDSIPAGYIAAPGMFNTRGSQGAGNDVISGPTICNGICGTLRYVNYAIGAYQNIGPADLIIHKYDAFGGYLGTTITPTNGQGELTIACPSGSNRHQVNVAFGDPNVEMLVFDNFWVFASDCGSTSDRFVDDENAHHYALAKYTVALSKALWNHNAPRVRVHVIGYSSYPPGENRINVREADAFTRGEFTVGHEYGHFAVHKAFGGLPAGYDTCPSPHPPGNPTSIGCAYSEDLATAHAMDILGTLITSTDYA
jgi:hypothetical protein